jgi:hypothetical protein
MKMSIAYGARFVPVSFFKFLRFPEQFGRTCPLTARFRSTAKPPDQTGGFAFEKGGNQARMKKVFERESLVNELLSGVMRRESVR